MSISTASSSTGRFQWLDSVKGIAVIWIVLYHFLLSYGSGSLPWPISFSSFFDLVNHCGQASILGKFSCALETLIAAIIQKRTPRRRGLHTLQWIRPCPLACKTWRTKRVLDFMVCGALQAALPGLLAGSFRFPGFPLHLAARPDRLPLPVEPCRRQDLSHRQDVLLPRSCVVVLGTVDPALPGFSAPFQAHAADGLCKIPRDLHIFGYSGKVLSHHGRGERIL